MIDIKKLTLKEKVEVIVVINSKDIEKNKIRGDLNINYESEVLTAGGSIVIEFPWANDGESEFFE